MKRAIVAFACAGFLASSHSVFGFTPDVTVPDTVASSSSGTFEIDIDDPTAAVSPDTIAGYTLYLVASPIGLATGSVTLTDASLPNDAILPPAGSNLFYAGPMGDELKVTDGDLATTAEIPTTPTPLFDVDYTVAAGTTGSFSIDVVSGSELYDPNENNLADVTFVNGTLTPVPEPASLSLIGLAGLLALRRKR